MEGNAKEELQLGEEMYVGGFGGDFCLFFFSCLIFRTTGQCVKSVKYELVS